MSEKANYKFKRGDTKILKKFNILDKEGNPIILTENCQLYFTMKTLESDEAILKKRINDGIIFGEDGFYHITLEAKETQDLDLGTYRYDIELDIPKDEENFFVRTIIEGKIELTRDVTLPIDRSDINE